VTRRFSSGGAQIPSPFALLRCVAFFGSGRVRPHRPRPRFRPPALSPVGFQTRICAFQTPKRGFCTEMVDKAGNSL
jgi:hypothetical protein